MSEAKPLWRRLYEGWLADRRAVRRGPDQIIVALVYVAVMGPVALIMRAGRGDPLRKRELRSAGSAWLEADSTTAPDLERAKRLF